MLQGFSKRSVFYLCGIVGFLLALQLFGGRAYAAGQAQITISLPNNAKLIGHVGTRVHLAASGFPANAKVDLFTTPNGDATKCTSANLQNPTSAQLTPFATLPSTNADGQGAFQVDTTWPSSANMATTNYYVCAIAETAAGTTPTPTATPGAGTTSNAAISTDSFTVAQQLQLGISSPSVQPGKTVTINGSGWLPPQPLGLAIVDATGNQLASKTIPASQLDPASGNFSIDVVIPDSATAGTYSVKVTAINEQTMTLTDNNALTVAAAAPTPTATQTPTVTPSPSPTPQANGSNGNTNGGGPNILAFGLGGLGIILIIIGLSVYFSYARQARPIN